jgi:hypothetical protein
MSKCLVTKLDIVVNDDNLYVIGGLYIRVKKDTSFLLVSHTPQTAKILTPGVTFTGGTQEYAVTSSSDNLTSVSDDCVVYVPNKTELLRIGRTDSYTEIEIIGGYKALSDCTRITRISFNINYNPGGVQYDLADLPASVVATFKDNYPPFNVVVDTSVLGLMTQYRQVLYLSGMVKGDVANLANMTAIPTLDLSNCQQLSGNISAFGSMTALTQLLLNNSSLLQGNVNTAFAGLTSATTISVANDTLITGSASQLLSTLTNLTNFNYSGSGVTT